MSKKLISSRLPSSSFLPYLLGLEVSDVTGVIAFLLSDSAAMINGVMLPIDGGFLAT